MPRQMVVKQTQAAEEDLHTHPLNNPKFVSAKDGTCLINKLPPELLSYIFEAGLAEGKDHSTVNSSDDSSWPRFPNLVSHVCPHWRNVAFSTPSLWTTIKITSKSHLPYVPQSKQLERTKALPLDIYVHLDVLSASSVSDLEFLYFMLVDHIHCWRTVDVSVAKYRDMHVFLKAVSSRFTPSAPQLTTLALHHYGYDDPWGATSEHLTLFGGSAPSLTSLILRGVHVDWDQPWIASASNLKVLELACHRKKYCPSWAQFSTILRNAPALEKFNLLKSRPTEDPQEWIIEPTLKGHPDPNGPIQLHRLSEFALAFLSPACASGLLRKFYLPTLRRLVLNFGDGNGDDFTDFVYELARPVPSFYPSQERSHSLLSRLEYLKIAGLPCRPECIRALYGELKNLMTLNISLYRLRNDFLEILAEPCSVPGQGDIWLPRLKTLYVSGRHEYFLQDMVEVRKEAGAPPISLYVERPHPLNDNNVEWLKKNAKTFEFFEESDDSIDSDDFDDSDD